VSKTERDAGGDGVVSIAIVGEYGGGRKIGERDEGKAFIK